MALIIGSLCFSVGEGLRLTPFPVAGKFGCQVVQTINGRRLDRQEVFATPHEAVRGGLDALRKALGW